MRTVEVSRFVPLQPAVVERALTPANVVTYEGTFDMHSLILGHDLTGIPAFS